VGAPLVVQVNQTGSFEVRVHVLSDRRITGLRLTITLSAPDYNYIYASLLFDADLPLARAAFEISHTPWDQDSMYGQFRELYRLTTELGVAVEEIRDPARLTIENLQQYDILFILDPCAYQVRVVDDRFVMERFRRYSAEEIGAIEEYWQSGGKVFLIGLGNSSLDLSAINVLLRRFNMTFRYDSIPGITIIVNGHVTTQEITDIYDHPATQGVTSFDYYGCSVEIGVGVYPLATVTVSLLDENGTRVSDNRTVLAALENANGGKVIVTGSNFFVDNWGLLGLYKSRENAKLTRQIVLWLLGILG